MVFFFSRSSGRSRRVEAFLAQVLQRRANHGTFRLHNIDVEQHPHLADKFEVDDTPVLVVIEQKRLSARLTQPRHAGEIERFLQPWLH